MFRTRSYRRDVRNKTIARKKRICTKHYGWDWYKVDGKYAKGKIHCSCKMCKYGRHFGLPTVQEMREREVVKDALNEFYGLPL